MKNTLTIVLLTVVTACFSSTINTSYKLTVQKTTSFGGLLTKSFRTQGSDCREIPVGWNVLHRWAIRVDGECIAVYESKDCNGPHVVLTGRGQEIKGRFSDFIKKIDANSMKACDENEEYETEEMIKPMIILTPTATPDEEEEEFSFRKQSDNSHSKQDIIISGQQQHSQTRPWSQNHIISWTTAPYGQSRPRWPPGPSQRHQQQQFFRPSSTHMRPNLFITFYSQPNQKGKSYYIPLSGCRNIPTYLQNQISSMDNRECVRLYKLFDCQGRSIQIQPDDDKTKGSLEAVDFDDMTSSFGPCEEFQRLGLQLHNYYRALHNSPPLKMVESLNTAAQLMAEYLATQPALPRPIGFISAELFYAVNNGPVDKLELITNAVASWYGENELYDYNNPISSRFTQLVWRNMTDFGIGTATVVHNSTSRRSTVVANYFPRGNFPGQFQENVLPLVDNAKRIRANFQKQQQLGWRSG